MLEYTVGFGSNPIESNNRARDYFNEIEGKKTIYSIYSMPGFNSDGTPAMVTFIWFTLQRTTEEQQAEKLEFIGSTGIDPNDPNWYEKWKTLQEPREEENTLAHIADH